jgi:hypothetical protein
MGEVTPKWIPALAAKRLKSPKRKKPGLGLLVVVRSIFARFAPFCGFLDSHVSEKRQSQVVGNQWVASLSLERTDTDRHAPDRIAIVARRPLR